MISSQILGMYWTPPKRRRNTFNRRCVFVQKWCDLSVSARVCLLPLDGDTATGLIFIWQEQERVEEVDVISFHTEIGMIEIRAKNVSYDS